MRGSAKPKWGSRRRQRCIEASDLASGAAVASSTSRSAPAAAAAASACPTTSRIGSSLSTVHAGSISEHRRRRRSPSIATVALTESEDPGSRQCREPRIARASSSSKSAAVRSTTACSSGSGSITSERHASTRPSTREWGRWTEQRETGGAKRVMADRVSSSASSHRSGAAEHNPVAGGQQRHRIHTVAARSLCPSDRTVQCVRTSCNRARSLRARKPRIGSHQ